MMGGWVSIISDRKSRIALLEFASLSDALARLKALVHVPGLVRDRSPHVGRFRMCISCLNPSGDVEVDRNWLTKLVS